MQQTLPQLPDRYRSRQRLCCAGPLLCRRGKRRSIKAGYRPDVHLHPADSERRGQVWQEAERAVYVSGDAAHGVADFKLPWELCGFLDRCKCRSQISIDGAQADVVVAYSHPADESQPRARVTLSRPAGGGEQHCALRPRSPTGHKLHALECLRVHVVAVIPVGE